MAGGFHGDSVHPCRGAQCCHLLPGSSLPLRLPLQCRNRLFRGFSSLRGHAGRQGHLLPPRIGFADSFNARLCSPRHRLCYGEHRICGVEVQKGGELRSVPHGDVALGRPVLLHQRLKGCCRCGGRPCRQAG